MEINILRIVNVLNEVGWYTKLIFLKKTVNSVYYDYKSLLLFT